MTTEPGTFDKILAEVGQAMLPLREALRSPQAFAGLLQTLGWQADTIPQPIRDLAGAVDTLYDSLRRLVGDGSQEFSPDEVARTLTAVQTLITGIRQIADAPDSAFPPALRADNFPTLFPRQLVEYLVITYLQRFHPSLGFALRALGVIKAVYTPPTGNRLAHTHLTLDVSDLPKVLADPSLVLTNAFGWGTPDFDFDEFASQVDNLLSTVDVDMAVQRVEPGTALAVQGAPPDPGAPPVKALRALVFRRVRANTTMSAEVRLMPVPADEPGGAPGLALLPAFDGALGFRFELGPDIAVTIRSDLDLQGGMALVARPGRGIDMVLGFESDNAPVHANGSIEVLAERTGAGNQPVLLLGSPDRTRLQFRTIGGTGGVRLVDGEVDAFAEFEVRGLEFVFQPDDADGFIAAILPSDGFRVGADLALGVSHRNGFYFRGTSNLDLRIPLRQQVGPVEIQGLTISALPTGDGLPIALGASFKVQLGPITAVVDRIGLTATVTGKPDHDGNLGPLDVALGFKPPTGVGLSISAGAVSGGGFLSFDPVRGEYAGALELEFADFLQLKAIGLISTRKPDGSPGFSLLVVLTAEFGGAGIQLGFGFRLLAVGGLLGLNRGVNLQALVEGVQTGSIESVAFPRDVIANAPRILSDLNRFFPAEEGRFLIGPMAKIGWGTPTLVNISLAVVIQIPGNIVAIGVLRAILPNPDVKLLVLQVGFVGALEPDKSRMWFFARLFDSRILSTTLDGGMGVLVGWGDNPDLVLTVGGFHPSFRPPPLPFPVPERLSVDILNQPGRLIRVSGYFAVTSNTVQFGARAELRLSFSEFRIEGHLAFDALFQFSPFRFLIDISAGVTLKAFGVGLFGIDLRFQLEGPAPWRARGRGSIGFLFFELSADFDITWGESRTTTLPPIPVLPLLASEIRKIEGWSTRLPTGSGKSLVNLRQLPASDDLVLHPLGTLIVRQRALPLGVRLDRIGAQRPSDGKRFTLAPAPGSGLTRVADTADKFPMAQFQDMSDAAKLSRPSYETQDAGLELTAATGALATARVVRRSARYELHVIDGGAATTPLVGRRRVTMAGLSSAATKRFHDVSPAVFGELATGNSTSRAPLSQRERALRQPFAAADTVRVEDERFVVAYARSNLQAFAPASTVDGVGHPATSATFRSRSTAADALAEFVDADPTLAGRLHVIPASEAAAPLGVAGTWSPAGTLPVGTSGIDAVRLANGRVLVAGGTDAAGAPIAAAALFDPTANAWSPTAFLATARRRHTTTRLADGRVLVAGGSGPEDADLVSTELYDPAAGTWSTGAPMGSARAGHTATPLPDGRVLVSGGESHGRPLDSAELFDPATGQWSPAASMTDARAGHQAVLLANQRRVLVVGGFRLAGDGSTRALAYCEVYDAVHDTWTTTGSLATPRQGHQATLLPDGQVLVTGGRSLAGEPDGTYVPLSLRPTERFDPIDSTWHPAADLPSGVSGHRALRTRTGVVLVLGGTGEPEATAGFRAVTAYDPGSDTWTTVGGLLTGRSACAVVELADQRVLVAGGVAAAGAAAPGPDATDLATTAEVLIP